MPSRSLRRRRLARELSGAALCALLLFAPSGCSHSASGQDFYRLDVSPARCPRRVELLREPPTSPFKEVALLGATCHGLAPYQCENRLLDQACVRRADAVVIRDQTFIGKKAEPRRMMTGSAIVYVRVPPSPESVSSETGNSPASRGALPSGNPQPTERR